MVTAHGSDEDPEIVFEDEDGTGDGQPGAEPIRRLFWLFQKAGLPFPPIPRELVPRLVEVEEWVYATREFEWSPLDIGSFVEEALTARPSDYVLIGHAGYGLDNWAMHYFLVLGPLAVFLQIPWGGVYNDDEAAVALMRERFEVLEQLIVTAERVLGSEERLLVVESAREGGSWARGFADAPAPELAWQETPNPVLTALLALERTG